MNSCDKRVQKIKSQHKAKKRPNEKFIWTFARQINKVHTHTRETSLQSASEENSRNASFPAEENNPGPCRQDETVIPGPIYNGKH